MERKEGLADEEGDKFKSEAALQTNTHQNFKQNCDYFFLLLLFLSSFLFMFYYNSWLLDATAIILTVYLFVNYICCN